MSPIIIGLMTFIGVAALVGGAFLLLQGESGNRLENRLDMLTGTGTPAAPMDTLKDSGLLNRPLNDGPGFFETLLERFGNINLLFEQADTSLTVPKLVAISGGLACIGFVLTLVLRVHAALIPVAILFMGVLPLCWLWFRRSRRMKTFASQLPDALEMMARSLRAGQSLGMGFSVVASEMSAPIGKEFNRVFEEQNLGIPFEDSLLAMCDRVPNLDLKFFVTAVILQRQTGGDLAEILDKIGELIRERFRILGQVQALTGEGRLSGVVLLVLPFVIFLVIYQMNPSYVSVLFTDPMGKKMLAVAAFMEIVGALVIRKIVTIKV